MGTAELFIIAVGVAMDAFAVSIAKGLSVKKVSLIHSLKVGFWFGGFQAMMPLVGYFLGINFSSFVKSVDHWIAFILLGVIGFNMIRESFSDEEEHHSPDFGFRTMLLMAIATSIDALAVGVSFAFLGDVNIWIAVGLIGVITAVLSAIGLYIGNVFGSRYKSKAEFTGGVILVLIGIKILIEHLFC